MTLFVQCSHEPNNPVNQIVEVLVGEYDVSEEKDCRNGCPKVQRFSVEDIIIHEDYILSSQSGSLITNDIALIRLKGLVQTVFENYDQVIIRFKFNSVYKGSLLHGLEIQLVHLVKNWHKKGHIHQFLDLGVSPSTAAPCCVS